MGVFRAHSSPRARLRRIESPFPCLFFPGGAGVAGRPLGAGRRSWPGLGQSFVPVPPGLVGGDGRGAPVQSRAGPEGAGAGARHRAGGEPWRSGGPGAGGCGRRLGRGRRCHSGRRGARSSLQPRSPVSQSPFQPLCGLLTGGGWSYIKAHYENYNIGPRACPRRQLGSFQALSPCSAGLSCKISI